MHVFHLLPMVEMQRAADTWLCWGCGCAHTLLGAGSEQGSPGRDPQAGVESCSGAEPLGAEHLLVLQQ